jgi:diadenylate cyclase
MLDFLNSGFLNVTLLDVVDIAVVSGFFIFLYRALKNTIALNILLGMIVIIALKFIANTIQLTVTGWILDMVSDVWLVAFIVLFHPEIRKMITIAMRSSFFNRFVKQDVTKKIDEVIEAVLQLSKSHTGALIVFAQSQNVQMTVDTGVPLMSQISKELIMSIFNTKSPLHDGAVIIENQMMTAAKCILPLSNQKRYGSKILGTRHRAALGLSEQVDAVILIVSEETKAISIAYSGELTFDIPPANLERVLTEKLEMDVTKAATEPGTKETASFF